MNVSAEQAFSVEHLNSSHLPGSFGTIESPTLVSAILNDGVVGCGGGNGEAEHVPQKFHCKEGLDGCGECEQIFMSPCVMYSLLGNAAIDLVDLDINEAGVRLSSRNTSWSEAGERLRSRVTSGARQALTPRFGAYAQGVATLVALTGAMSFRTAPSVQHRIEWMRRSSPSKMPTWKRKNHLGP